MPVDFVSTHVYANDTAQNVMHTSEDIPRDKMVWRAVKMVHDQIAASPYPAMPLIFSEYNASYANEPNITDSVYMGAWLANNIRLCDGLTASMAYWAFLRCIRRAGNRPHTVLRRLRPDRRRPDSRRPTLHDLRRFCTCSATERLAHATPTPR